MTDRDQADCCGPPADPRVARRFDRSWTDWDDAEGFPEIVDVSARLVDQLRDATLERPSVLEIGCGTGGVSVALLEMGARSVKGVDLSAASVDLARRRAAHAGFAEQATFEVGQGAAVLGEVHDWVVVDRVLCCDGNLDRLLAAVIGAARSRIAVSVPESRGWRGLLNRPMWAAENVWDLLHQGCRGYVHDVRRIEQRLASAGFREVSSGHVGLWHVAVYAR
ncbi:MAG: methyltransferase domain-containing protein [Chloroflexota bacterium]|nr:methyltransferase domain-containing protein [Chloroflexota bacterium]